MRLEKAFRTNLRQWREHLVKDKIVRDFVEATKDFTIVDFFGFAKILGIKVKIGDLLDETKFEDFIVELSYEFSKKNRFERKKLYRTAAQIAKNNKEFDDLRLSKKDGRNNIKDENKVKDENPN